MTRTVVHEGQLMTTTDRDKIVKANLRRRRRNDRERVRRFDPSVHGWDDKGNYRDRNGRFAQAPFPIPWNIRATGQKRIVEARQMAAAITAYYLTMTRGLHHKIERPCCGRLAKVLIRHLGVKVDDNGNWTAPEFRIRRPDRVCQPCAFPWSVIIDEDKRRWSVAYAWQGSWAEVPCFRPNLKIEGTSHWTARESPAEMVLASTPPSAGFHEDWRARWL